MTYSEVTLSDMPSVVLNQIFNVIGIRSILTLRKVSSQFRDFIKEVRPPTYLKSLTITITEDCIYIYMDPFMDWSIDIEYQKHENGKTVRSGQKQKLIKNQNFLDGFFNDFQLNLQNQKDILEMIRISFECFLEKFLYLMVATLESREFKLRVEELNLEISRQEEIMSILPYLDPDSIKKISISSSNNFVSLDLNQVIKLDQWKNANELEMYNCIIPERMEHFRHFSKANVNVEVISSDELYMLKEAFLDNPNFTIFTIKYKMFEESPDLSDLFGDPVIDKHDMWSFEIPGNNDQVLLFVHFDTHIFRFSRVERSSIYNKITKW